MAPLTDRLQGPGPQRKDGADDMGVVWRQNVIRRVVADVAKRNPIFVLNDRDARRKRRNICGRLCLSRSAGPCPSGSARPCLSRSAGPCPSGSARPCLSNIAWTSCLSLGIQQVLVLCDCLVCFFLLLRVKQYRSKLFAGTRTDISPQRTQRAEDITMFWLFAREPCNWRHVLHSRGVLDRLLLENFFGGIAALWSGCC